MTLSPAPYYANPSSSVGGGAVGLAPYFLYRSDCIPPETAVASAIPAVANTTLVPKNFDVTAAPIQIRFYGPIRRASENPAVTYNWASTTSIVKIECMPLSFSSDPCLADDNWFNVTNGFATYGPGSETTGIAARTLSIGRSPEHIISPGLYRVKFLDVRCAGLTLATGVVPPLVKVDSYCPDPNDPDASMMREAYYFRVGIDCDYNGEDDSIQNPPPTTACTAGGCADRNRDGLSVQDIFNFLNEWFAGCTDTYAPCHPDECPGGTADFNHSGALEVQDIFDYLNAWFAGTNCG